MVKVVVIGAGIVGASTALWLQREHPGVLLLDGRPPGSATTYGNACTLATYGCVPINSPTIFKRLPRLLFSRDSPLRVDWRYALRHLPWQISFLRNCTPDRVQGISKHLASLLGLTDRGIDPLIERIGGDDQFAPDRGCFYVFGSRASYEMARSDTEIRRYHGTCITELNGREFRELEPNVRMPVHRALLLEGTRFLRDPQRLVEAYVDRLVKDGGRFRQEKVVRVESGPDGIVVYPQNGPSIGCERLVIAAGAWSKQISGSGAEDLPLDTERGYHILFKSQGDLVTRPIAWVEGGFYATPMAHGLRLAGTVELAGLSETQSDERIAYLNRSAREMFGDLGAPDDTWLGFRPTFPDALPVIGFSPRSTNIVLAFGHQHLGLTLGGATGMLVADLFAGRKAPIDLAPFSPSRFL